MNKVYGERLLVTKLKEDEKSKTGIILGKVSKSYAECKVIGIGDKCMLELNFGDTVIVKNSINTINIEDDKYIVEIEDVLGAK
jgi:co-chaperonin GroES (HSP10)